MDYLKDIVGIKKIELIFENDRQYLQSKKNKLSKKLFTKIKVRHFLWLPSLVFNRLYNVLPKVLKDLLFCFSVIHKSPSSKIFARTKYDEIRTLIDIKVSSLILKIVPRNVAESVKNTFQSGYYTSKLTNISELEKLAGNVIDYANPSHAGARPYFKDGKNKKIDESFSAYYTFSPKDSHKINSFLNNSLEEDLHHHLSALAGYKCKLKNVIYSVGIVYGENSNSEMHQDTYSSVLKGFIYLNDIGTDNSPFEYLERSYLDAKFRSEQTNIAILNDDSFSSGSTRLRGKILVDAISKYGLRTFTGSKGLLILANTAGYHRKGKHNSPIPRITLGIGFKRKGIISKLLINLFFLVKHKLSWKM